MFNDILNAFDTVYTVRHVLLDISAIFNTITHILLLNKV